MDYDEIEILVKKAKAEDKSAKEELIMNFLPMILNLAKKVHIDSYEFEDVRNEGCRVLLHCVKTYDITRHRFVAYATRAINNSIKELVKISLRRTMTDGANALTLGDFLESTLPSKDLSLEELLLSKELNISLHNSLCAGLKTLNPKQLELVYFLYIKNYTLRRYAAFKGYPYATVVHRKHALLKQLRRNFK